MKDLRIKAAAIVLLFALAICISAEAQAEDEKAGGTVASSAEQAKPLQKGAKVPELSFKTADGKAFDLNASIAEKPTVLIFYRGGW